MMSHTDSHLVLGGKENMNKSSWQLILVLNEVEMFDVQRWRGSTQIAPEYIELLNVLTALSH